MFAIRKTGSGWTQSDRKICQTRNCSSPVQQFEISPHGVYWSTDDSHSYRVANPLTASGSFRQPDHSIAACANSRDLDPLAEFRANRRSTTFFQQRLKRFNLSEKEARRIPLRRGAEGVNELTGNCPKGQPTSETAPRRVLAAR